MPQGDTLQLSFDGEVRGYELLHLTGPSRLALDLPGVKLATSVRKGSGPFSTLRVGAHPDKVRLVVDVEPSLEGRVAFTRNGLRWAVAAPAPASAAVASAAAPAASPQGKSDLQDGEVEIDGKRVVTAAAAAPNGRQAPAEMLDLGFDESSRGGRIQIKLSHAAGFEISRPDSRSAVLTLDRGEAAQAARAQPRHLRAGNAGEDDQRLHRSGRRPTMRVVVAADGALDERAERVSDGLLWRLEAKGTRTEEVAVSNRTAGFTTEARGVTSQSVTGRTRYVGKKVSFEFKDIDIHNLLRVIAEICKKNIVVADDVSGKVTIRLRNVPWDQALDLILSHQGPGQGGDRATSSASRR